MEGLRRSDEREKEEKGEKDAVLRVMREVDTFTLTLTLTRATSRYLTCLPVSFNALVAEL